MGTPFDYPLSSRMDENDSILIFDKVHVPWENVFAYGDIDKVNNFFPRSGFLPRWLTISPRSRKASDTSMAAFSRPPPLLRRSRT